MKTFRCVILFALVIPILSGCDGSSYDKEFDKGLLSRFRFEENSNSLVKDETGNLPDKTVFYHLHDSPTISRTEVQFKDGVEGQALVFDGYSTYVSYNSDEIMIGGMAFTIAAWIAPRAYNYAAQDAKDDYLQAIASQYYNDGSYSMGFTFGYKREGKFSFGVGTNNGWYQLWDEGSPLTQYEWNNVMAVFDGEKGDISLYLNGRIVNRMKIPAGTSIEPCDQPFTIGKNTVTSSSGDCLTGIVSGLLDDLRLYKRVVGYREYKEYIDGLLVDGQVKEAVFADVWVQNTLTDDAYKPQFHGGPYEHWMNEPHAPFYYNGLYHLFFQFNPNGPYFNDARGICWGHLTSPDMVSWTPRREVIVPMSGSVAPDGIWSGGSTLDKDGNPVLFFTAGDYAHPGLVSNQNIGIAYPKDLSDPYLSEWVVDSRLAIAQQSGQGRSGEFRDAHLYKDGDDYFMLIGSGDENSGRGTAVIYHTNVGKTDYLHNWEYKGHVFDYANSDAKYGSVWELPVLLPLKNLDGTQSGKSMLAISPAPASTADNDIIYWLGDFDKNTARFTSDFLNPRVMDYGANVFTGPSGFVNPNSGEATLFSIMQSQREASDLSSSGWSHNVGLTRELYYDSTRQDLGIRIIDEVISELTSDVIMDASNVSSTDVNAGLSGFDSDMYALKLRVANLTSQLEIKLRASADGTEYTSVYINPDESTAGVNTGLNMNNSRLSNGDFSGTFTGLSSAEMTIYVDRSQIEVIVNNQKTICARSYPKDLEANGLSVNLSGGGSIEQLIIYELASIF